MHLGSIITNNVRYTWEIKSRIFIEKSAFNSKRKFLTRKLGLNIREAPLMCSIWGIHWHGADR